MTVEQRVALRLALARDEGIRLAAYPDHLGFLTIGIGRLIDPRKAGAGISQAEAEYLCDNDICRCLSDLEAFAWFQALNPVRQNAVLNMRFQLGLGGFRGFRKMLEALAQGDYIGAGEEGRNSSWARTQTPERANRVMGELETGYIRENKT